MALRIFWPSAILAVAGVMAPAQTAVGHDVLVKPFEKWRAFERPTVTDGVLNHGAAAMQRKATGLEELVSNSTPAPGE